ncbi:tetratricopeptide repeat protein [Pedomonas mirosovicensis]|uniref:tetratricopeptide repeat protein n=1 Tax=Pedomonas mirosovicensis TaxID=2908641 RepID=UPI0021689149|nr:tetratricopeptide repeat protein [Pedomonas mirosovicensis]MCH8685311.1 tetratricopeptide repeat protein [Pedomonas mirosovicensis]
MQQCHWISALAISAALAFSGPALAKAPSVNAASSRLMQQGNDLLSQNKAGEAADYYESALAADPDNSNAFIGLGRAYEQMGLTGKAISYYRKALIINPNDLTALEASGMAYIAKGSLAKAEDALDKLRRVCRKGCSQAERLAAALSSAQAKGASRPRTVAQQQATPRPKQQKTIKQ